MINNTSVFEVQEINPSEFALVEKEDTDDNLHTLTSIISMFKSKREADKGLKFYTASWIPAYSVKISQRSKEITSVLRQTQVALIDGLWYYCDNADYMSMRLGAKQVDFEWFFSHSDAVEYITLRLKGIQ